MPEIRKTAFIVNPISGGKNKKQLIETLRREMPASLAPEFIFWQKLEDIAKMAVRLKEKHFDLAVAVGGDGTINLVARALLGTDTVLGIIPAGSGNGLARHLGIPLNPSAALRNLAEGKVEPLDCGTINGELFCCTAGVGFDARVGQLFAQTKGRGFLAYAKVTLRELFSYKADRFSLRIDGKEIVRDAYLLTFANASQYGNNAFIAPGADSADKLLDVCIVRPFRPWQAPGLLLGLFNKKVARSKFYETHRGSRFELTRSAAGAVHFDGEPAEMPEKIVVEVLPAALRVIVPERKGS